LNDSRTAEAAVRAAWSTTLHLSDIAPEDTFFSLGGDSLTAIEVMESVESALGIEFPLEVLFGEGTFSAVVGECASRCNPTEDKQVQESPA